jgi:hypothetical protein
MSDTKVKELFASLKLNKDGVVVNEVFDPNGKAPPNMSGYDNVTTSSTSDILGTEASAEVKDPASDANDGTSEGTVPASGAASGANDGTNITETAITNEVTSSGTNRTETAEAISSMNEDVEKLNAAEQAAKEAEKKRFADLSESQLKEELERAKEALKDAKGDHIVDNPRIASEKEELARKIEVLKEKLNITAGGKRRSRRRRSKASKKKRSKKKKGSRKRKGSRRK